MYAFGEGCSENLAPNALSSEKTNHFMIGLFLIYFIGRAFYELAFEYDKSRWGFAIVGVISYYAGANIGGLGIILVAGLLLEIDITTSSGIMINLMSVPFGLLACWGLYRILKSNWEKGTETQASEEVLDSDLSSTENQKL